MIVAYAAITFGISAAVVVISTAQEDKDAPAILLSFLITLPLWGRVFGWW